MLDNNRINCIQNYDLDFENQYTTIVGKSYKVDTYKT
jgi:hypothetical protein